MYRAEEMWGTVISVDVRDRIDPAVVDECYAFFTLVDELFSTWRDDSEIMRIGRGELHVWDASPEVREVLALCDGVRLASGGAFDVTAGARAVVEPRPGLAPLDPSGLVKGWAVERAGAFLAHAGARCFSVNAGGDVLTHGDPGGGWRVGIQHPWTRDRVAAVLCVTDAAVATSGRYERGDHVFDPHTGRPVEGLVSVTVVGPDLAIADGYATAVMVLGERDGMGWLAGRAGFEGMAITDGHTVITTTGFDRYRLS